MSADPERSRQLLLALVLAACGRPTGPDERISTEPKGHPMAPHVDSREHLRPVALEAAAARDFRVGTAPIVVDLTAGPLLTPRGIWSPGSGADALFSEVFAVVDEQAYWIQPELGAPLLRIARDLDRRWLRDDFACRGWLLGERDDLLWCADIRDDQIEVTVVDKTGFGAPSLAAILPWPESLQSSLHPRLDGQGPLLVADRVVVAAATGFVMAELEGDGVVETVELGHRPSCVVARGPRLAWRVHPDGALYSGELPLAAIRREYAGDDLIGCPAWAGDSLLFRMRGEALELWRRTEDGRLLSLEGVPPAFDVLVSDAERAWWLVRDHGLWWIDATSHGRVDTTGVVPFAVTADEGLLLWRTVEPGGRAIHASDVFGASVVWR